MRSDLKSGEGMETLLGRHRRPEREDVEGLILRSRQLRAQWLRQQAAHLGATVRGWLEPLVRAERRRADLRALLALDDRVLADIGLRRDELFGVLYGVVPWERVVSSRQERLAEFSAWVIRLPQPEVLPPAPSALDRAA